jgi:hypothetical protein
MRQAKKIDQWKRLSQVSLSNDAKKSEKKQKKYLLFWFSCG